MPNYAALWQAAWTPFAGYLNTSTIPSAHAFVTQIEGLNFTAALRQLDPFYSDLDSHRIACRNLHGHPTDQHYSQAEVTARHAVQTQRPNFLTHAQQVLDLAAQIGAAFQKNVQNLKGRPDLLKPAVGQLSAISKGVKTEVETFATPGKADIFLDNVRRNP